MRIGLVVERFVPHGGGAENAAWQVARGLAAAGDRVEVIAREAWPAPGIRVRRASVPRAWQPLRVTAFSRAAARAAPRGRYDVSISFSRTRHQDVYRAGGGSHADYMEHCYGPAARALRRLSPRHTVLLAQERAVFADATQRIVCGSELVRTQLARRYGVPDKRLHVLPNGVDLETFHPGHRALERARLRAELGVNDAPDALVWLFSGSGFARKGLDTALRALAQARPRDAQLWVAGGDAIAPWRRLAQHLGVAARVRFLGWRRDAPALCAASDALLLPTRYDAFANACLEAAAAGLPVATSACNGAVEALGDAACRVEDPEDVAGFAAALERLADGEERARRGAAVRAAAEAHGWDAHVARLRAFLSEPQG